MRTPILQSMKAQGTGGVIGILLAGPVYGDMKLVEPEDAVTAVAGSAGGAFPRSREDTARKYRGARG